MMRVYVLFACLCAMATTAASPPVASPEETCRLRASELLAALRSGAYAQATDHFDAQVSAKLSASQLEQVWHSVLPAQFGSFVRSADTTVGAHGVVELAETPLEFANGWLTLRLSCNADGTIGGLFFAPGSAPASARVVAPLNTNGGAIEKELALTSPLGPLPGTLTLPSGDGVVPAVLLIAGSGPNDRDESIGPNKPFADIAQGLAAKGIASLRYDKRTRVYAGKMTGGITVDDEVTDDAVSALKMLMQQLRIDAKQVFVLGHSLGALMLPRILAREPGVKGGIALAAPATLDLDIVIRQMRYVSGVQHATPQQIEAAIAPVISARDAIAHADPQHPPPGEFFHAPASYWLSLRGYDAIAVARSLQQPLLVLQGGGDYQVTPADDFVKWQRAFAGNGRVTLKLYPELSHLFMPAGSPPSPADYAKAAHVDAGVIRDITAWITAQAHAKTRLDVH